MTPQERELLEGLFERIRTVSGGPRDAEAEAFIAQAVRATPTAPYLLSQTVIVQEEALKAAAARIEELQAQVDEANRRASEPPPSFLGGIGKSLFGETDATRARGSVPSVGSGRGADAPSGARWTQQGQPVDQQPTYGGQPMGAPGGMNAGGMGAGMGAGGMGAGPGAGQPGAMGQAAGGGSFLKGAMGAAAGVAGGMLLANSLSGLFKQNNPLGIAGGGADKAGEKSALDDKGAGESGWGSKRDEQATPASHTEEDDGDDEDDGGWDDGDDGYDDGQDV